MKMYGILCCFLLYFTQSIIGMNTTETVLTEISFNINRAMLIFLDDSESDDAIGDKKFGAVSNAFFCAFAQQAGPLIVSASLIDNLRQHETIAETDPQKLVERFDALQKQGEALDDAGFAEQKKIFLSVVSFNEDTVVPWIIKKINEALYLLIPKKYLKDMKIAEKDVLMFTAEGPITVVEQLLGLKVNHMATIEKIDEIKKPIPAPPVAEYFMDALYNNTRQNPSSIFVTNGEYYKLNNKNIPSWSIYITGHGTMGITIVHLALQQFKDFLTFLERGIHTKLLYYASCYAAGVNNKILYEDVQSGIDKIYSFAIITQAITDVPTIVGVMRLVLRQGQLIPMTFLAYNDFVQKVTVSEEINYKELASCFVENLKVFGVGGMLPQVKFPGIPWFSVIDETKVCSIGSVLAKTRTKLLDIETFFTRKGKRATPLGILFYAQDVPFELIINTKNSLGMSPAIISMIPGNAIHHMKKISSQVHTAEDLLLGFLQLKNLGPQKIFIIDEVSGKKGLSSAILQNVVIELTPQQNTVYYKQKDKLFKNITEPAAVEDANKYAQLLALSSPVKNIFSKEQVEQIKTKADKSFTQEMDVSEVHKTIVELLDDMPNGMVIHIPKINGISCPPTEECWLELIAKLAYYSSLGTQKIVWFDELELYNEEGQTFVLLKNIIVDVDNTNTTVFATLHSGQLLQASIKTGIGQAEQDYVPEYLKIFQFFDIHRQLPERRKRDIVTTQELLTPEAVANIEKVQEQKQQKMKKQRLKEEVEKKE